MTRAARAAPAPPLEDLYTMKDAARKLAFPSPNALRMFLFRRPGLAERRYRGLGRRRHRLLTDSEVRRVLAMAVTAVRAVKPQVSRTY